MQPADSELVARARSGDRAAFSALVERYAPLVEWLANRLLKDREVAADCAQTALVRAWERLPQLREDSRFASWLQAICRTVATNMRQSEAVRQERETSAELAAQVPDSLDRLLTRLWVRKAVDGLPEAYRRPVRQYYLEGLSQREIARQLEVPLGTLKARLHYARLKLREVLSEKEEMAMEKVEFTDLMEAFMGMEEPEPRLSYEELARQTLEHYDLGELRKMGSAYRPSDSIAIAIETARGRFRIWRYQPWMTRELVDLESHILRHLQEKELPVKRLIPGRNGETAFFVDNHFVSVFAWFSGAEPEWERSETQGALGDLCGRWVAAMADFDPGIANWCELASSWRPRKGWALALPCFDLAQVPERMALSQAVRELDDPPPYHDQFLRGVDDTEARLQRFSRQVEALRPAELPHAMNHGVILGGLQDFEQTITLVDDYVYEPRVGDLGRLLYVAVYEPSFPGAPRRDRARLLLDAFQRHVSLSPAELRALPWVALSFALFYRVFHILLYLGEIEDGPETARYLVDGLREELASLARQEDDVEKLTEVLLES